MVQIVGIYIGTSSSELNGMKSRIENVEANISKVLEENQILRNVIAARENQIHDMMQILGDLVMKFERKKADMKCGSITADEGSDIHNGSSTVDDTYHRMEDGEDNTESVSVSSNSSVNFENYFFAELTREVKAEFEGLRAEVNEVKGEMKEILKDKG